MKAKRARKRHTRAQKRSCRKMRPKSRPRRRLRPRQSRGENGSRHAKLKKLRERSGKRRRKETLGCWPSGAANRDPPAASSSGNGDDADSFSHALDPEEEASEFSMCVREPEENETLSGSYQYQVRHQAPG